MPAVPAAQTLKEYLHTTPSWFAGFLEAKSLMDEWEAIQCIDKPTWTAHVATLVPVDVHAGGEPSVVEAALACAKKWALSPWTVQRLREYKIIAQHAPPAPSPAEHAPGTAL